MTTTSLKQAAMAISTTDAAREALRHQKPWFSGISKMLDAVEKKNRTGGEQGWSPAIKVRLWAGGKTCFAAQVNRGLVHDHDPVKSIEVKVIDGSRIRVRYTTKAGRREDFLFSGTYSVGFELEAADGDTLDELSEEYFRKLEEREAANTTRAFLLRR